MDLNDFYHESFKKWLKGKCSPQAEVVSNSYEGEGITAEYDMNKEEFIIYPQEKEYPLGTVRETLHSEELFNALVTEMMSSRPNH
ncbi:hypothetical protein [Legionella sp. km772]|uniref:hypothetical protein n=1 Tax=Legionella sp. km772 TaxID=2498111 RepID=UPI000F8DFEDC|nr:hypothetical protein [Legionella sp. km772]RUR05322.1 hypothetical protein ELY15_14450 [Legionella sp. km772]